MIVAINKIDKPDSKPQKVREELLQHEIIVEDMGGDVQDVEVSALKKTNLDKLLEAIHLQAEILELKANPDRAAEGTVIEAKLDKGRGPLATVLVQRGTLQGRRRDRRRRRLGQGPGDARRPWPAGEGSRPVGPGRGARPRRGAVRRRPADRGRERGARPRGRRLSPGRARPQAHHRRAGQRREHVRQPRLDDQGAGAGRQGRRPGLGRGDRHRRSTSCRPTRSRSAILNSGVGAITESDVTLAASTGAPIIGFNVRPNAKAREVAEPQPRSSSAITTSSTTSPTG